MDQVELKCTTDTVELVDEILPEDMVQFEHTNSSTGCRLHLIETFSHIGTRFANTNKE